jgi:hypothetical protein
MNMPCGANYISKWTVCSKLQLFVRCNLETVLSAAKSNKIYRPCAQTVTIPIKTTSTLLFPLIIYWEGLNGNVPDNERTVLQA